MRRGPGPAILLEPEEGVGISVCVEDCDAVEDKEDAEDWAYGELAPSRMRLKQLPIPTAMPPVSLFA